MGILIDARVDTRRAEQDLQKLNKGVASINDSVSSVKRNITAIATAATSALTVGFFAKASNDMVSYENRVAVVTGRTKDLIKYQKQLFNVAIDTNSSIQATIESFSSFGMAAEGLGKTNRQLVKISKTIQQAAMVGGGSKESHKNAIIQLGQGIGSDTLAGDELRSVRENTPFLAKAIARDMGVSVSKLIMLGEQRMLTGKRVMEALENQSKFIEENFKKLAPSLGDATTNLKDFLGIASGRFLKGTEYVSDLTSKIKEFAKYLADHVEDFQFRGMQFALDVTNIRVNAKGWYNTFMKQADIKGLYEWVKGGFAGDLKDKWHPIQLDVIQKTPIWFFDFKEWKFNNQLSILTDMRADLLRKFKYIMKGSEVERLDFDIFNGSININVDSIKQYAKNTFRVLKDSYKALFASRADYAPGMLDIENKSDAEIFHARLKYIAKGIADKNGPAIAAFMRSIYEGAKNGFSFFMTGLVGRENFDKYLSPLIKVVDTIVDLNVRLGKAFINGNLVEELLNINKEFSESSATYRELANAIDSILTTFVNLRAAFAGFKIDDSGMLGSIDRVIGSLLHAVNIVLSAISKFSGSEYFAKLVADTKALSARLVEAFKYVAEFSKNVINEFFIIWDAVIAHSWWTDTIAAVEDSSKSLSGKALQYIKGFSKSVVAVFSNIFIAIRSFFSELHNQLLRGTGFGESFARSIKASIGKLNIAGIIGNIDLLVASRDFADTLRDQIKPVEWKAIGKALYADLKEGFDLISKDHPLLGVKRLFGGIGGAITTAFPVIGRLSQYINTKMSEIWPSIKSAAVSIFDKADAAMKAKIGTSLKEIAAIVSSFFVVDLLAIIFPLTGFTLFLKNLRRAIITAFLVTGAETVSVEQGWGSVIDKLGEKLYDFTRFAVRSIGKLISIALKMIGSAMVIALEETPIINIVGKPLVSLMRVFDVETPGGVLLAALVGGKMVNWVSNLAFLSTGIKKLAKLVDFVKGDASNPGSMLFFGSIQRKLLTLSSAFLLADFNGVFDDIFKDLPVPHMIAQAAGIFLLLGNKSAFNFLKGFVAIFTSTFGVFLKEALSGTSIQVLFFPKSGGMTFLRGLQAIYGMAMLSTRNFGRDVARVLAAAFGGASGGQSLASLIASFIGGNFSSPLGQIAAMFTSLTEHILSAMRFSYIKGVNNLVSSLQAAGGLAALLSLKMAKIRAFFTGMTIPVAFLAALTKIVAFLRTYKVLVGAIALFSFSTLFSESAQAAESYSDRAKAAASSTGSSILEFAKHLAEVVAIAVQVVIAADIISVKLAGVERLARSTLGSFAPYLKLISFGSRHAFLSITTMLVGTLHYFDLLLPFMADIVEYFSDISTYVSSDSIGGTVIFFTSLAASVVALAKGAKGLLLVSSAITALTSVGTVFSGLGESTGIFKGRVINREDPSNPVSEQRDAPGIIKVGAALASIAVIANGINYSFADIAERFYDLNASLASMKLRAANVIAPFRILATTIAAIGSGLISVLGVFAPFLAKVFLLNMALSSFTDKLDFEDTSFTKYISLAIVASFSLHKYLRIAGMGLLEGIKLAFTAGIGLVKGFAMAFKAILIPYVVESLVNALDYVTGDHLGPWAGEVAFILGMVFYRKIAAMLASIGTMIAATVGSTFAIVTGSVVVGAGLLYTWFFGEGNEFIDKLRWVGDEIRKLLGYSKDKKYNWGGATDEEVAKLKKDSKDIIDFANIDPSRIVWSNFEKGYQDSWNKNVDDFQELLVKWRTGGDDNTFAMLVQQWKNIDFLYQQLLNKQADIDPEVYANFLARADSMNSPINGKSEFASSSYWNRVAAAKYLGYRVSKSGLIKKPGDEGFEQAEDLNGNVRFFAPTEQEAELLKLLRALNERGGAANEQYQDLIDKWFEKYRLSREKDFKPFTYFDRAATWFNAKTSQTSPLEALGNFDFVDFTLNLAKNLLADNSEYNQLYQGHRQEALDARAYNDSADYQVYRDEMSNKLRGEFELANGFFASSAALFEQAAFALNNPPAWLKNLYRFPTDLGRSVFDRMRVDKLFTDSKAKFEDRDPLVKPLGEDTKGFLKNLLDTLREEALISTEKQRILEFGNSVASYKTSLKDVGLTFDDSSFLSPRVSIEEINKFASNIKDLKAQRSNAANTAEYNDLTSQIYEAKAEMENILKQGVEGSKLRKQMLLPDAAKSAGLDVFSEDYYSKLNDKQAEELFKKLNDLSVRRDRLKLIRNETPVVAGTTFEKAARLIGYDPAEKFTRGGDQRSLLDRIPDIQKAMKDPLRVKSALVSNYERERIDLLAEVQKLVGEQLSAHPLGSAANYAALSDVAKVNNLDFNSLIIRKGYEEASKVVERMEVARRALKELLEVGADPADITIAIRELHKMEAALEAINWEAAVGKLNFKGLSISLEDLPRLGKGLSEELVSAGLEIANLERQIANLDAGKDYDQIALKIRRIAEIKQKEIEIASVAIYRDPERIANVAGSLGFSSADLVGIPDEFLRALLDAESSTIAIKNNIETVGPEGFRAITAEVAKSEKLTAKIKANMASFKTRLDTVNEYMGQQLSPLQYAAMGMSDKQFQGIAAQQYDLNDLQTRAIAPNTLKGLLVKAESGSAGYNAYNKGRAGDSVNDPQNISGLTIGQLKARRQLGLGDKRIFAAGMYQIVPNTLQGEISRLGIPDSAVFTPALQDHIFGNGLMKGKRPEVFSFITGLSEDIVAAQNAFANEFMGVKAANGKGVRDGDKAGNRASVSSYDALLNGRRIYQKSIADGLDANTAWENAIGLRVYDAAQKASANIVQGLQTQLGEQKAFATDPKNIQKLWEAKVIEVNNMTNGQLVDFISETLSIDRDVFNTTERDNVGKFKDLALEAYSQELQNKAGLLQYDSNTIPNNLDRIVSSMRAYDWQLRNMLESLNMSDMSGFSADMFEEAKRLYEFKLQLDNKNVDLSPSKRIELQTQLDLGTSELTKKAKLNKERSQASYMPLDEKLSYIKSAFPDLQESSLGRLSNDKLTKVYSMAVESNYASQYGKFEEVKKLKEQALAAMSDNTFSDSLIRMLGISEDALHAMDNGTAKLASDMGAKYKKIADDIAKGSYNRDEMSVKFAAMQADKDFTVAITNLAIERAQLAYANMDTLIASIGNDPIFEGVDAKRYLKQEDLVGMAQRANSVKQEQLKQSAGKPFDASIVNNANKYIVGDIAERYSKLDFNAAMSAAGVSFEQSAYNLMDATTRASIMSMAEQMKAIKDKLASGELSPELEAANQQYLEVLDIKMQDSLRKATESIIAKADAAGKDFADSLYSNVTGSLKSLIMGEKSPKEALKEFGMEFAGSMIDSILAGFMDPIKEKTRTYVEGLGATLFMGGADAGSLITGGSLNTAGDAFAVNRMLGTDVVGGGIPGSELATSAISGATNAKLDSSISELSTTVDEMPSMLDDLIGSLSSVFDDLFNGISDMLSSLASDGSDIAGGIMSIVGMAAGSMGGGASAGASATGGGGYASGGYVSGPGTGTSDSIGAWLSNGEYVMTAKQTRKHLGLLEAIRQDKVGKFAKGGTVGATDSSMFGKPITLRESDKAINVVDNALKGGQPVVFNMSVTGDISRQTKREIFTMMPEIASEVNRINWEKGVKR